jgi:hypothetical protein
MLLLFSAIFALVTALASQSSPSPQSASHLAARPTLAAFCKAYKPFSYPAVEPGPFKTLVGGGFLDEWMRAQNNMCAARMSAGLNGAGVPLPASRRSILTLKGRDNRHYAIRVRELRDWLIFTKQWRPQADVNKTPGRPFNWSTLPRGVSGIVAIDWNKQQHFGLYYGSKQEDPFSGTSPTYYDYAARVTFWQLPAGASDRQHCK